MPVHPRSPTFFYVTGFPKSGNKWLQWQLIGFESLGGFHVDLTRGLPLLGSKALESEPLRSVLDRAGVSIEQFVRRAYWPADGSPLHGLDPRAPVLAAALDALAIEAGKICRTPLRGDVFQHLFAEPDAPPALQWMRERTAVAAVGVPGMHTPLDDVRRDLPSFRIVNLQRDPRDVVVSYFYHYISTLTLPLAEKFIIRDPVSGSISHNPRWKRPFARRVMRSMSAYHQQRLPEAGERDGVLRVRYEDLLHDGEAALERLLRFLGCEESPRDIARVVQANRFEQVTGSTEEQRGSLIRKGQSGDWRNYFDRELLRALGDEFPAIVRDLGYEPDDRWMNDVPAEAVREFEFSRFRIRRSTMRQFEHLWSASPQLRERFPNPWEPAEDQSFYDWLCRCDHPEVQQWLELARKLEELWAVDVVES